METTALSTCLSPNSKIQGTDILEISYMNVLDEESCLYA
jgi:hypothetical protein